MATKRRRNGKWHYRIRRADLLPRPLYLSFDDEAEGDEYVRRIEALLDRGVVPDEFVEKREVQKTLREGIRRYLSEQHVSDEDADLLKVVQMRLPRGLGFPEMTFTWATAWVSAMKREQNLAPSTIRHHVGALARALDWLAAHGELPFNPLRLLPKGYATYTRDDGVAVKVIEGKTKTDNERDRRLEGDEEARIREALAGSKRDDRQRALELRHGDKLVLLFDIALESAMRMREMYTLSVGQIDLEKKTIFLDRTKNGSKRQVPITSVLLKKLRPAIKGLPPDAQLFPWWDGDLSRESLRKTTSLLSRQFSRIFETAQCAGLHFHDLRHEATSRLFERTKLSDIQISKITGHTSLAMLKRYANLRGSDLAEHLW
ncbi:site-specific integrase [Rhodanobacter sp. BL-MT-08]